MMNKLAIGEYAPVSGPLISIEGWEWRHMLSLWAMVTLAIASGFWAVDQGFLFIAVYSGACGFALLTAQALRVAIYDALIQFHYREKFGLFLFHIAVLAAPSLFGLKGWHHALSALLVILCFQAVHILGMGRIYAAALLLGIHPLLAPPLPPFFLTAGLLLMFFMAIRFEHLRFRLERYGKRNALPAGETIRESAKSVLIPWGAGVVLYGLFFLLFAGKTRRLEFRGGLTVESSTSAVGPVSMSQALYEGILLAGLVIASLVLLHWLEKKLRGKQRAHVEQGEGLLQAEEEFDNLPRHLEPDEHLTDPTDPRGRILSVFRDFAIGLGKLGYQRREGETARAYVGRIAGALLSGEEVPASLPRHFNRACYSTEEITDDQATEFVETVRDIEPRLRDEIARQEDNVEQKDESKGREEESE